MINIKTVIILQCVFFLTAYIQNEKPAWQKTYPATTLNTQNKI